MVIYNVTTGVDRAIELEWLEWMREIHIPEVMRTKMFVGFKFYKVLTTEDDGTVSYAVQYSARSLGDIDLYLEKFAPSLRNESKKKFGDRQAAFRTVLEEV